MNTETKSVTSWRRRLRAGLLAVSVTAAMGGAAMAPALADEGWRHERFEREHWREHERWEHRHYAYVAPRYYGYPAPVYAAPTLNLVVPLHIR